VSLAAAGVGPLSGDEAAGAGAAERAPGKPVAGPGDTAEEDAGDGAGVRRADAAGTRDATGAEDGDGDAPAGEARGDEARGAIEAGKGEDDATAGGAVGAGAAMMSASRGMSNIATRDFWLRRTIIPQT